MIRGILLVCAFYSVTAAAPILERQWLFASAADVSFVIPDTLSISVQFPNAIPDDRLIGYTRFRVTISDSNAGELRPGSVFLYRLQFDAGFLYFDHMLTFEMKYASGLLPCTADPRRYVLMLDPFPTSRLHQWFGVNSFTVDPVNRVLRFTYRHAKYASGAGTPAPPRLAKACIASSGYPYEYALFLNDSAAAVVNPSPNRQHLPPQSGGRTVVDARGRAIAGAPRAGAVLFSPGEKAASAINPLIAKGRAQ
jgi:hypothetical protein